MLLSFEEFNNLYESNNSFDESYSDGIDVMESLITVINKKGSITDTELHTFLDNVLENTGWKLNDEVYENYNEWLEDWSPYIDVTLNEAEDEVEYSLTKRGEALIENRNFPQSNNETLVKINELGNMDMAPLSFGLTKKRREIRKGAYDAYSDRMGHDKNKVSSKIKRRIGMAMPSLPGSKRSKAKHAAIGQYHKGRSEAE